jgi:hypothetical protein
MGERVRARVRVSVRTAVMQVSLGSAERGGGGCSPCLHGSHGNFDVFSTILYLFFADFLGFHNPCFTAANHGNYTGFSIRDFCTG